MAYYKGSWLQASFGCLTWVWFRTCTNTSNQPPLSTASPMSRSPSLSSTASTTSWQTPWYVYLKKIYIFLFLTFLFNIFNLFNNFYWYNIIYLPFFNIFNLFHSYPPHIIANSCCVYIYLFIYMFIFPVPRIVATALNIWGNNDIFLF